MKARAHSAFWRTWFAKFSGVLVVVVAMAPQLAPPELAAWFHDTFPGLPAWASWGIAIMIGVARYKASNPTKETL